VRKKENEQASHQSQEPKIPMANVGSLVGENCAETFFVGLFGQRCRE
jgi:hypothetical protein